MEDVKPVTAVGEVRCVELLEPLRPDLDPEPALVVTLADAEAHPLVAALSPDLANLLMGTTAAVPLSATPRSLLAPRGPYSPR